MAKKKVSHQKPVSKSEPKSKESHGEIYYKDKLKKRFWMLVNYLSIPLISAIVFGFAAGCEALLFRFLWSLMANDIQQSSIIKNVASWVQIAITVSTFVGFVIHSAFSLYGQIQVEKQFSESED